MTHAFIRWLATVLATSFFIISGAAAQLHLHAPATVPVCVCVDAAHKSDY